MAGRRKPGEPKPEPPAGGWPSRGPGKGPASGIPARGTAPAFEPGNAAALTHGARSPARVEPLAAAIAADLVADAPWLGSPAFAGAVRSIARLEAQARLLADYLDARGPLDDDGEVRNAAEFSLKVERALADQRSKLGLDPTSRARLERDTLEAVRGAVDLDAIRARGRAALERRGELEAPTDAEGEQ